MWRIVSTLRGCVCDAGAFHPEQGARVMSLQSRPRRCPDRMITKNNTIGLPGSEIPSPRRKIKRAMTDSRKSRLVRGRLEEG